MTRPTDQLRQPIFIIGAARSGTEMLGDLLCRHPAVAYWIEPKYIWRYGRPAADSDVREASEASPPVSAYIRSRFAAFARRRGKTRFMEKTPSNCFRISFIDRVFPDGLFLHLLRDGRDVAVSAHRKWTSPPSKQGLWRRARSLEIPARELPHYAVDLLRETVGRQLHPRRGYLWGPRFPGAARVRAERSVLETCALQWRASVEAALAGLAAIPDGRCLTVKFEELVQAPEPALRRVLAFLRLEPSPELLAFARAHVDPAAAERWRSRPPEEVAAILPLIGPILERLGYALHSAA